MNSEKVNKFYVYGLFEPTGGKLDICFYIGKGCDDRLNEHFWDCMLNPEDCRNSDKVDKILNIRELGKEPYSRKIFQNLSEERALELESLFIKEIGIQNLTNKLTKHFPLSNENHPNYGKKLSKELKERISESNSQLTKKEVMEIKWLFDNSKLNCKEIKDVYGSSVKGIVYGSNWTHIEEKNEPEWYSDDFEQEIIKKRKSTKLFYGGVKEVNWLLDKTSLYQYEIAEKYNVTKSCISDISVGRTFSNINERLKPDWF